MTKDQEIIRLRGALTEISRLSKPIYGDCDCGSIAREALSESPASPKGVEPKEMGKSSEVLTQEIRYDDFNRLESVLRKAFYRITGCEVSCNFSTKHIVTLLDAELSKPLKPPLCGETLAPSPCTPRRSPPTSKE